MLGLILGLANAAQANSFSKDLEVFVKYGAVSRSELISNLNVYQKMLSNISVLLRQRGEARRTDSIKQIAAIERSIEDQKGWMSYLPQGDDSSAAQLDRAVLTTKKIAAQKISANYNQNLLNQVASVQKILRQTAADLKNGK